jgi:hypothetical protein
MHALVLGALLAVACGRAAAETTGCASAEDEGYYLGKLPKGPFAVPFYNATSNETAQWSVVLSACATTNSTPRGHSKCAERVDAFVQLWGPKPRWATDDAPCVLAFDTVNNPWSWYGDHLSGSASGVFNQAGHPDGRGWTINVIVGCLRSGPRDGGLVATQPMTRTNPPYPEYTLTLGSSHFCS